MDTQTYFHTKLEREADKKEEREPLVVNCTGAVAEEVPFSNRSVRKDYYYLYILEGQLLAGNQHLTPGDVILFEPGYRYQYESVGPTTYLWVHFTGYEARLLAQKAVPALNKRCRIGIHEEITSCFEAIFREFLLHDEPSGEMSVCLLRQILLWTKRFGPKEEKKNVPLKAIAYIHQNYKKDISVEELAALEAMGRTSFDKAFRSHTGTSAHEYLLNQRLSAACHLLTETKQSIGEVAALTGYRDPYYFSRIFKKKMGVTPFEYRKNDCFLSKKEI